MKKAMKDNQSANLPTVQHSNNTVVGIITISDRASAGHYDDLGGPALKQVAQKIGWHVLAEAVVPDEMDQDSGNNSIVCQTGLRPDFDDGRHGYRLA